MISRRAFIQGSAAAMASPLLAQDVAPWKVGGFTKVLQELSYEKTAETAVDIGWDGIECPVRAKGQVLPERVDEDLPRMMEALRAKKLEMLVPATDIQGVDQPHAPKVLKAFAKAGIKIYRLGGYRYKEGVPIAKQIEDFRAKLKELGALSKELGLTGLYQNHSGNGYAGSAIWDIHEMTQGIDGLGVHFDIGHATVEQGLSWPTAFKLVQDRVGAVIVKDFYWKHAPGEGGKTQWCGIGEGSVNPKFFQMLRASGFTGPITMQFEYPVIGGNDMAAKIAAMKEDNRVLRGWLKR